jgi:hypothetical protein
MVKWLFPYTHVNKTQEFKQKKSVMHVNLEAKWG